MNIACGVNLKVIAFSVWTYVYMNTVTQRLYSCATIAPTLPHSHSTATATPGAYQKRMISQLAIRQTGSFLRFDEREIS